jgi:hypothetical protein
MKRANGEMKRSTQRIGMSWTSTKKAVKMPRIDRYTIYMIIIVLAYKEKNTDEAQL